MSLQERNNVKNAKFLFIINGIEELLNSLIDYIVIVCQLE